MSTLVYLAGLSGRGFRVKNSAGARKVVRQGAIVRVDVDDPETRIILAREKNNFVKVANSNSNTAKVYALSRNGFRVLNSGNAIVVTKYNSGATLALNGRTYRVLMRNKGAWIAVADGTAAQIRGLQEKQNGFDIRAAGSQPGATTTIYKGITATVDLRVPFNFQQLRRHYKSWIEV